MKPNLILIRGPSGFGKSTFAKNNFPGYFHFEADQYFVGEDGVYRWRADMLQNAHQDCLKKTRNALLWKSNVKVSNTFTRLSEMEAYQSLAEELNVPIKVFRMMTRYRNKHNVPESVVDNMISRMEDFDGEFRVY